MEKTKERAKFVYGQEMEPCPKCGSYDMKPQTPIKLNEEFSKKDLENPKKLLGQWARKKMTGEDWLEGPCYFMCFECGHKGPSVDCSGRTSTEIGQDRQVYAKMKELWNTQK